MFKTLKQGDLLKNISQVAINLYNDDLLVIDILSPSQHALVVEVLFKNNLDIMIKVIGPTSVGWLWDRTDITGNNGWAMPCMNHLVVCL